MAKNLSLDVSYKGNLFHKLITILFLFYMAVTCIAFYCIAVLIWILTILFDRRLVALHMFTCFWGVMYLWLMPWWSTSTIGREKMKRNRVYIIVSNHQSMLDILIAHGLFFPFKWVSKTEAFRIPFVGWNMVLNRYIRLERGNKESIKQMFNVCKTTLKNGSSVFFFPEGTRSPSGIVRGFKYGAFKLAKDLELPILPVVINGTKNALPKGSLNFTGRQNMSIKVLDEIKYEEYKHLEPQEIADEVRQVIIEHVEEHKVG